MVNNEKRTFTLPQSKTDFLNLLQLKWSDAGMRVMKQIHASMWIQNVHKDNISNQLEERRDY